MPSPILVKGRSVGFTLIELLIVIAIILILISIALPNFLEAQMRAKVAKARGDIRSIATGMETYFLDERSYPNDCPGAEISGCIALTTPVKYLKTVPMDPFGLHRNQGHTIVDLRVGASFYPMGTGLNLSGLRRHWPIPAPYSRENPPVKEVYIIYSAGPSDEEPGDPTGTYPIDVAKVWMLYSPTNGTDSFGGIIVTGGQPLENPLLRHLKVTHF